MAPSSDTIAALATPAGSSALALIRVSGPDSRRLAQGVFDALLSPRVARHGHYRDRNGVRLDDVVWTFFAGPATSTGEDALEISCHGNPFIAQKILEDLWARGCRPAEPGEFTRRAFLNGRMDLSQAEAVMDLIRARSDRALAAARRMLEGGLSRHLEPLTSGLTGMLARIEAQIDFPEEDLPPQDRAALGASLESVRRGADRLLATLPYGELLRDGIGTVIVGEPNAGKSSLLNRLVGRERAIVSAEPGTTRDFIEERVVVGPHGLRLIDTAGLNPAPEAVEQLGIGKTLERIAEADLLLVVLDATRPTPAFPPALSERMKPENTVVVLNKADLLRGAPVAATPPALACVRVSALTGEGVADLTDAIARIAEDLEPAGSDAVAINARHAEALGRARACLEDAAHKLDTSAPPELLASDLRGALDALGEISGKIDHERVLDRLFAEFCIGK
ncbi:MAG TPA: tRNA uridine-5-carboxymethylaminomethyl(34) synthesis GTPase MnmE [Opitutaceae bacterium]|nr:tRNA uridine-5-carboxymethylaminomethyl(34) synthesis GTPase MnmE [Opitutaceae bacterium]